jgi:hypothetical protein
MTDFIAEGSYAGGVTNALTERSGAVAATDTVPAGALIVARNTGAGTHTIVLACNFTVDGLAVTSRTHTLLTSTIKGFRVPAGYGDANGRVAISVGEGTFAEVKYYVLGA